MDSNCFICKRILLWGENKNPYFIHEFENSIFVLGDHQYFKGYSLLLLKKHIVCARPIRQPFLSNPVSVLGQSG